MIAAGNSFRDVMKSKNGDLENDPNSEKKDDRRLNLRNRTE